MSELRPFGDGDEVSILSDHSLFILIGNPLTTKKKTLVIRTRQKVGPSLAAKGYGAGLTLDQVTRAVRMMPELLALYYENSVKPSIPYMYNQMQGRAPAPKLIEEAAVQLNLEGTDPADAFTFAYLHSIGVSWGQLRILVSSLPLWRTVNLETNCKTFDDARGLRAQGGRV